MSFPPPPPVWTLPDIFQCLEESDAGDSLVELVESFRSDSDSRLARLREALHTGDLERACAEAHSLKGSAHQMGAEALAAECLAIEREIAGSQAPTASRIDRFQDCLTAACDAMRVHLSRRG